MDRNTLVCQVAEEHYGAKAIKLLARAGSLTAYDLSIGCSVGWPGFPAAGGLSHELFLSHAPDGTAVGGNGVNRHACYEELARGTE